MSKEMQFKEVTIRLGFWEDADGYPITQAQWRDWLHNAVKSWHHTNGPQYSVSVYEHTQTVMEDEDFQKILEGDTK